MLNDFPLSAHFNLREFQDNSIGVVMLDPELVVLLEKLRTLVGTPLVIHSGYRTPATNTRVGGASNSYHLRGMAADLSWNGMDLDQAASLAATVGFRGIGLKRKNGHLHVDTRPTPARWEE